MNYYSCFLLCIPTFTSSYTHSFKMINIQAIVWFRNLVMPRVATRPHNDNTLVDTMFLNPTKKFLTPLKVTLRVLKEHAKLDILAWADVPTTIMKFNSSFDNTYAYQIYWRVSEKRSSIVLCL